MQRPNVQNLAIRTLKKFAAALLLALALTWQGPNPAGEARARWGDQSLDTNGGGPAACMPPGPVCD